MATKGKRGKQNRKSEESEVPEKKSRAENLNGTTIVPTAQVLAAGKIRRIFVRNFMCHDALEIILNPNVNFIIGRNGSGKSAILTALTVGLGARAQVTNRGGTVKEFIKKGKSSARIELTIINEGPMAFKPEVYGKTITVVRTIGSASKYQLKNESGKIVSSKREELVRMMEKMNIQVDNPISVLNQDVSRSFLTTSSASDKYTLFVKATQIEVASNRYREALLDAEEAHRRLENAKTKLAESKKEVVALENSMKLLESVEKFREEVQQHEVELHWANAIVEENALARIEKRLASEKKYLEDMEGAEGMKEQKEKEIQTKIEELEENIRKNESERSENSSAFDEAHKRYLDALDTLAERKRAWASAQVTVKRTEGDITLISQEIKRLKSMKDTGSELALRKKDAATKKQELDEIEAMLRTKKNEEMHYNTDKLRLQEEEQMAKITENDFKIHEASVRKKKQQLASLKQQSDIAVSVFGSDIPRLLKRIEEEYSKGRFKRKPVGPLGAYIKIRNPAWTPAVESCLGYKNLSGFAVDNWQDCKLLKNIMNEIYRGKSEPAIFSSQFSDKAYDVSQLCVKHPQYKNLYEMMEISDPVVANCVIDQIEPECILLVATNEEASELFSDYRKVPKNCKRGLTLEADEYYPDPQYRSYAGDVGKPRFLQVSTADAIVSLEEELKVEEEKLKSMIQPRRMIYEKLKRVVAQLNEVSSQVGKLTSMQLNKKLEIDRLAAEIEDLEEPDGTSDFVEELAALEGKLKEQKETASRLRDQYEEMQRESKELEVEVNRLRDLRESMDSKVYKIKDEINNLKDQKEMLDITNKRAKRVLTEARRALQKSTAEYETQKRVTDKFIEDAEKQCPRIDTERTPDEIKRAANELKATIRAVEQQTGSREEIEKEFVAKRNKYNKMIEFANELEKFNVEHLDRLKKRNAMYRQVKTLIGITVQKAFTAILKLRNYEGTMKISHANKTLELDITPNNTAKRAASDARTLSGGERSYSTVAFILALWECTSLPFYFLDEFDVFMDKVNRRIILDILLEHTRNHPRCQFTFLTPLDTTIPQIDNYLTIHQLAAPERGNNNT